MGRRGILALLSGLLVWPWRAGAETLAGRRKVNDLVRQALRKEGDDGLGPRHVDHWAFPASGGISQAEMIAAMQKKGFEAEPSAGNGGVRFGHVVAVAGVEFDALTLMLARFCDERGWT